MCTLWGRNPLETMGWSSTHSPALPSMDLPAILHTISIPFLYTCRTRLPSLAPPPRSCTHSPVMMRVPNDQATPVVKGKGKGEGDHSPDLRRSTSDPDKAFSPRETRSTAGSPAIPPSEVPVQAHGLPEYGGGGLERAQRSGEWARNPNRLPVVTSAHLLQCPPSTRTTQN